MHPWAEVHPQAEQEVKFFGNFFACLLGRVELEVGVVNFALLACVLKTTTKKGQLCEKKVHPQRENPGCLC